MAWAKLRFEEEMGPVPVPDDSQLSKGASASWAKAKASHIKKNTDTSKTEQNLGDAFAASYKTRETDKANSRYDKEVQAKIRDIVPKELKWGEPFENNDGDLPGDKGARGYAEYYAKPDAADAPSGGFWAQNRVLVSNSGAWYATADHWAACSTGRCPPSSMSGTSSSARPARPAGGAAGSACSSWAKAPTSARSAEGTSSDACGETLAQARPVAIERALDRELCTGRCDEEAVLAAEVVRYGFGDTPAASATPLTVVPA
jgi:hypothetical protein